MDKVDIDGQGSGLLEVDTTATIDVLTTNVEAALRDINGLKFEPDEVNCGKPRLIHTPIHVTCSAGRVEERFKNVLEALALIEQWHQ